LKFSDDLWDSVKAIVVMGNHDSGSPVVAVVGADQAAKVDFTREPDRGWLEPVRENTICRVETGVDWTAC